MTTIKPGDCVRTKGAPAYPDGTEFTVTEVVARNERHYLGADFTHYATGDPKERGVWTKYLEVVEPAAEPAPPVEEYRDPRYEALLRRNQDLEATLRKRKETIDELRKLLDESTVGSALSQAADQAGLAADDAVKALELGARFLALGYEGSDFDFLMGLDMKFRRRFHEKKAAA